MFHLSGAGKVMLDNCRRFAAASGAAAAGAPGALVAAGVALFSPDPVGPHPAARRPANTPPHIGNPKYRRRIVAFQIR
jgi:hypothetical protein